MRTALLVLSVVVSAISPQLRAGVTAVSSGHTILAMEGPDLAVGSSVTLITADVRQEVRHAVVAGRVAESPEMARRDIKGPYYDLAPAGGGSLPGSSIAVLGRPAVTRQGDAISLRISAEYPDVRARSCTSREGVHLTLWAGQPLKGRRLWHQYFYLGYDVEPDCQPADYENGTGVTDRRVNTGDAP